MAGRDAGRYHDVVAAGLRARHVHLYESALVLLVDLRNGVKTLVSPHLGHDQVQDYKRNLLCVFQVQVQRVWAADSGEHRVSGLIKERLPQIPDEILVTEK